MVSHSLSGTVAQERLGSADTRICNIQLLSDFLSPRLPVPSFMSLPFLSVTIGGKELLQFSLFSPIKFSPLSTTKLVILGDSRET